MVRMRDIGVDEWAGVAWKALDLRSDMGLEGL